MGCENKDHPNRGSWAETPHERFAEPDISPNHSALIESIRLECIHLAQMITTYSKESRERSLALTRLEEVYQWAKRAIAQK